MIENKMKEKLLIVDGSELLFQSFYGMPKMIEVDGRRIEAVICFIGILRKVIKLIDADYVYVVFDGENKLVKSEINEEYKAGRKIFAEGEDSPFDQLEIIEKILKHLKINSHQTTYFEGDDEIAGMVKAFKDKLEIVILSQDKDFFQLIGENVSVLAYRGKKSKMWDIGAFVDFYTFQPAFYALFKSMVGDKSDNVRGIKGIGEKSAIKILCEYQRFLSNKMGTDITDDDCDWIGLISKLDSEGKVEMKNFLSFIDLFDNVKLKKMLSENLGKLVENYSIIKIVPPCVEVDLSEVKDDLFREKVIDLINFAIKCGN